MCGKSCYERGFNLCYIRPDIHASHKKSIIFDCFAILLQSHLFHTVFDNITPHTLKTGFMLLQMVNNEAFFDYSLISERYIFVPMPKLRMYIHITRHWLEVTVLLCTFSQLPPPVLSAVQLLILYGSSKRVYNSMKGRFTEVSFLWLWYVFVWGFFWRGKCKCCVPKMSR